MPQGPHGNAPPHGQWQQHMNAPPSGPQFPGQFGGPQRPFGPMGQNTNEQPRAQGFGHGDPRFVRKEHPGQRFQGDNQRFGGPRFPGNEPRFRAPDQQGFRFAADSSQRMRGPTPGGQRFPGPSQSGQSQEGPPGDRAELDGPNSDTRFYLFNSAEPVCRSVEVGTYSIC